MSGLQLEGRMSNLIGQSLGRYHILEQLGEVAWRLYTKPTTRVWRAMLRSR